jgi:hypothetical protein
VANKTGFVLLISLPLCTSYSLSEDGKYVRNFVIP